MNFDLSKDVYYSDEYISLYLNESDRIFKFEYKEGDKVFMNKAIKKSIDALGRDFFDLETAYGYGGYYINTNNEEFIQRAVNKYKDFCKSQNIVAEFIRFHPFLNNIEIVGKFLDFFRKDRKVVYIDLEKDKSYRKSLIRNIKKAIDSKLNFKILEKNRRNIELFIDLYYKTMERNKANSFYFFSENYFYKLMKMRDANLYGVEFKGKIINMVVTLDCKTNGVVYYHLGATDPIFYNLNPNPFIFDNLIDLYKLRRFKILYLGGGISPKDDDSLFKFKKKFSQNFLWYYLGGNIFHKEIYSKSKERLAVSDKFLYWRE